MQSWTRGTISCVGPALTSPFCFCERSQPIPAAVGQITQKYIRGCIMCWKTAAPSPQQCARYLVKQTLWFASASPFGKLVNCVFMLSDGWIYFLWQSLHQKMLRVVSSPDFYCTSFSGICRNKIKWYFADFLGTPVWWLFSCWANPSIACQYILGDLLLML